jgi:uncharacterized membrane protein
MKNSKSAKGKQPRVVSAGSFKRLRPKIKPGQPVSSEMLDILPADVRAVFLETGKPVSSDVLLSMAMYRGPYMPAAMAAEYERYFPGWGTRMLELAEKQVGHRQELESVQVERSENRMDFGQRFGFAIAGMCVVAAMVVLTTAPPSWYSSIAAVGLAIVGVGGPTVARIIASSFDWSNQAPDGKKP